MAICTKCGDQIPMLATACPTCGWDFPQRKLGRPKRSRFYYSVFADAAILVAMVASWVAVAGSVVQVVLHLIRHDWWNGLFWFPLSAVILMGLAVALGRAADLHDDSV